MKEIYELEKEPLEPTWETALSVWWSILWRWLLWGIGIGTLVAVLASILAGLAGDKTGRFGFICAMITFVAIGNVAVWQVLRKSDYHDFKLLLFAKKRTTPVVYAPLKMNNKPSE